LQNCCAERRGQTARKNGKIRERQHGGKKGGASGVLEGKVDVEARPSWGTRGEQSEAEFSVGG